MAGTGAAAAGTEDRDGGSCGAYRHTEARSLAKASWKPASASNFGRRDGSRTTT